MPNDHRYEIALRAALAIIYHFDRPEMTRQKKLACVTYAILDSLNQAAIPAPADVSLVPGSEGTVRQIPANRLKRLGGGKR